MYIHLLYIYYIQYAIYYVLFIIIEKKRGRGSVIVSFLM